MHPFPPRRILLPRPRLQLRMVAAFAGITALAMLVQTLVLGDQLTRAAEGMSSGGTELARAVPGLLLRSLAVSVVLVLPALMLVGIRVTFRTAGPIYRFERHLESIARGEWPGPCRIRKEDELQEFCELLNEALASARSQGRAETSPGEEQPARDAA